jgi:proprotein convertase P-domain-containing protein
MAKINARVAAPAEPPAGRHHHPSSTDGDFVVPKRLQGAQHPAAHVRDGFDRKAATGPVKALGTQPSLTPHGGAVLDKPAISNIYLGDYWKSGQGAADVAESDAAAVDFGKSKMMDVAAQYGAGKASFLGSTVMGGPAPARMTEADIQSTVRTALANGSVPKNAQGVYTVMLPPGTVLDAGGGVDSKRGLGGFHGSMDDGKGNPIYYAAIAHSDTNGNGINFDNDSQHSANVIQSHEWMEAMTDPDVNSTIPGRGVAWADDQNGSEIGDEMVPIQLNRGLNISQAFQQDAGGFMQQMEWSNKDKQFEIDTPAAKPPPPPPPPRDPTGSSAPHRAFKTHKPAVDTINLGDGANIGNLKVSVDITHRKKAGVTATLTAPSGKSVNLPLRPGKHESGTFNVSDFNGQSSKGPWRLTVQDTARGDSGKLMSWSLDAALRNAALRG